MDKTAIKTASDLLDSVPARNEEALVEYIKSNKKAQSDLKAYVHGPKSLSAFQYAEAGGILEELELKLPMAERILEAVREEIPQDIDSGYEEEFDLPTTVSRLAAQKAMDTQGMPELDKFYSAKRAFQENIEPILVDGFEEFPRQQYMETFERYARMHPEKLRKVIAEEFPKNDWIGEEPEAAGDDLKTPAGEEGAPAPEDDYLDEEFGDGSYKGVLRNRQSSKTSSKKVTRYVKISEGLGLDDDLDELEGSIEPVSDITDEGGEKTYWIEHEGDLIGFDPADVEELQVVPEDKTDTRDGFEGALNGDSNGESDSKPDSNSTPPSFGSDDEEEDEDDEEEEDKDKDDDNPFGNKDSRVKRKRAVENNQGADIVGDGNNDPHVDDGFESWFDGESGKNQKKPTGPNRDKRSSVDKLGAALKLAETYEIDADDALELVEKVLEDE